MEINQENFEGSQDNINESSEENGTLCKVDYKSKRKTTKK